MKRIALILALALLAPTVFAKTRVLRRPVQPASWRAPQCTSVGLPWLRFIDAKGVRRASHADPPVVWREFVLTTQALAIGGAPNVLWAITIDGSIHESVDAGCTWAIRATVPEILGGKFEPELAARHPERVYAWHGRGIVRLTGGTVETFSTPAAGGDIVRLEVDPARSLHVRAITKFGHIWESFDGASTWKALPAATFLSEVTAVAFHPRDFDHIVVGTKGGGLRVSRDGGKSWTDGPLRQQTINDIFFSPADPRVMWVDTWPGGVGAASRLYRSNDGGATFAHIGSNGRSIWYFGRLFAPHPRETETYATHARNSAGIQITSPAATRSWIHENVKIAVWSPSGTLYFVEQVVQLR